jgi:glycosyltransferase involved in cell wall biosynthesis
MPIVSVIIPCFNVGRYVGEAIRSVTAQSFTDLEIIVVDDGSTDDSAGVVEANRPSDTPLALIARDNGGVGVARASGYERCDPAARYVLFLDADDRLAPSMLAALVGHLERNPEAGLAYCDLRVVDEHGASLGPSSTLFEPRWRPGRGGLPEAIPSDSVETPFVSVFCFAPIIPSTAVLRRSVFEAAGGWDTAFGQPVEDTDLYLRMALRAEVHHISEPLVDYRRHAHQNTADLARLRAQNEKLRRLWAARAADDAFRPHAQTIRDALLFDRRRLAPANGVRAGRRELRRGRPGQAVRFVGSGFRTALRSYVRDH